MKTVNDNAYFITITFLYIFGPMPVKFLLLNNSKISYTSQKQPILQIIGQPESKIWEITILLFASVKNFEIIAIDEHVLL